MQDLFFFGEGGGCVIITKYILFEENEKFVENCFVVGKIVFDLWGHFQGNRIMKRALLGPISQTEKSFG